MFKNTIKQFIEKAFKVHKNNYLYDKVNYVNSKTNVTIICPIHGDFEQTPHNHLKGQRCPKCYRNVPLTKEEFIRKARAIHGYKYDYSKVEYVNSTTKLIIICPIHGEFEQTPNNHLQDHGCPYCGAEKTGLRFKYNNAEFISKARLIHGDKYDYSKVEYINSTEKIIIVCKKHGEFEQTPVAHIWGSGCLKCGLENRRLLRMSTKEEFIRKARLIHGDKYDYSKVIYTGIRKKVTIICPIHGEFNQIPESHLKGNSCSKCNFDKMSLDRRSNLKKFLKKARAIHGNKYDYNKVVYINNHTKVVIVCPMHGEFEQTPANHHSGKGCPICNASKGELAIKAILDKHNIRHIQEYRIPEIYNILFYDFYLPDHNLLIEFHGKQHYEYIPHFHRNGEDDLLVQKNRDDAVRYNAKYFKYRYLEFNYKQLKELSKEEFETLIIKNLAKYK